MDLNYWADRVAAEINETGRTPFLSTGISPSGHIHIGNVREVLTADVVYRVLLEGRQDVVFNYVADDYDPLRRVYDFLDASIYAPLVGQPLSEVCCPCGKHSDYSQHFLEPFLEALGQLRVNVTLERASEMYKSGRMTPFVLQALEGRDRIVHILHEQTGKTFDDQWSPFNPICETCGRMAATQLTGYSVADETVRYRCPCGGEGERPIAGGGKLTWRVDWPARWAMFGVTVEPFGKDHSTRGGSYDTGVQIARDIYDCEPPFPIQYEWIRLKGGGDMSSSKGNVLSVGSILEVVPPEVLRYMIVKDRPGRRINFDPGMGLLRWVDELDDPQTADRSERAVELSRAGGFEVVGIPFKHLIVVGQAAGFVLADVVEILRRTGFPKTDSAALEARLGYAQRWLRDFAPEEMRFEVQQELPAATAEFDADQRRFLGELAVRLTDGMQGDAIHGVIYEIAGSFDGVKPGRLFQSIYVALLGKSRGPRAGWFVSLLGVPFCSERFREASS